MAVLYEDKYLVCDEDAITIKEYYFPVGSKRIAYDSIKKLSEHPLTAFSGKFRFWGMDLVPYWYHLDWDRHKKYKGIVLDTGNPIKAVITPEQFDMVWVLLKDKVKR